MNANCFILEYHLSGNVDKKDMQAMVHKAVTSFVGVTDPILVIDCNAIASIDADAMFLFRRFRAAIPCSVEVKNVPDSFENRDYFLNCIRDKNYSPSKKYIARVIDMEEQFEKDVISKAFKPAKPKKKAKLPRTVTQVKKAMKAETDEQFETFKNMRRRNPEYRPDGVFVAGSVSCYYSELFWAAEEIEKGADIDEMAKSFSWSRQYFLSVLRKFLTESEYKAMLNSNHAKYEDLWKRRNAMLINLWNTSTIIEPELSLMFGVCVNTIRKILKIYKDTGNIPAEPLASSTPIKSEVDIPLNLDKSITSKLVTRNLNIKVCFENGEGLQEIATHYLTNIADVIDTLRIFGYSVSSDYQSSCFSTVIRAYLKGKSVERIANQYSTVPTNLIKKIIADYESNPNISAASRAAYKSIVNGNHRWRFDECKD